MRRNSRFTHRTDVSEKCTGTTTFHITPNPQPPGNILIGNSKEMKGTQISVVLMLLLATLGWGILLRDLSIAFAYSNSFALLDEHWTLFVF